MLGSMTLKKENSIGINDYIKNDSMSLSSTEIILKIYDFAILQLKKKNSQKALRAITELIVSLNFDYQELAPGLYRLYQYCKDQIYRDNLNEALVILVGLRDAWAKAFNLT